MGTDVLALGKVLARCDYWITDKPVMQLMTVWELPAEDISKVD
jgi:hypothetical protein